MKFNKQEFIFGKRPGIAANPFETNRLRMQNLGSVRSFLSRKSPRTNLLDNADSVRSFLSSKEKVVSAEKILANNSDSVRNFLSNKQVNRVPVPSPPSAAPVSKIKASTVKNTVVADNIVSKAKRGGPIMAVGVGIGVLGAAYLGSRMFGGKKNRDRYL